MNPKAARAFAQAHIDAWNARDLDRIMDAFADDCELVSPLAARLVGDGRVRGKEAVRAYFERGLRSSPDLQLELLDVLRGVDSLTLYFRSLDQAMVADVFFFDAAGKVTRLLAHYSG